MRIAHLELGRHLYGGAEQLRYLLDGLRGDAHQHWLVTPVDSALYRWADDAGIRCLALAYRGEHDLSSVWRLARWLRRERIELLHVHSRRGADWIGALAATLAGVRVIITRRVDNPPGGLLTWLMRRRFARVVCISEAIHNVLLEAGVDEDRMLTINSAVDAARYQREPAIDARQRLLGEPHDGPLIAVIAQLIERKGHRFLLDGLAGLIRRFPDLKVVFLGRGPREDELREAVRLGGFEPYVHFAGFLDDLESLLPAVSLVVHPALTEGLGVSLLQAAAAGVPVVAFAAGGVTQAVADEHSGLLVRTGDSIALAAAIGRLLGDDELRSTMGANAARRVAREFSVSGMVKRHAALYDVLAGELL